MKRTIAGMALAATLFLTGCDSVSFLYPLYKDKTDLAVDTDISGNWTVDGERWTFDRREDGTYRLTWAKGKDTEQRDVALVRVSNYLFLDLTATEETAIRGHEFAQVRVGNDRLEIALLDGKWMETRLGERALPYEKPCSGVGGKSRRCVQVITAGPGDLQNFFMRYAPDAAAFKEWAVLRRM